MPAATSVGATMAYFDELVEFHIVPKGAAQFFNRLVFRYRAFQRWSSVTLAELAGDAAHTETVGTSKPWRPPTCWRKTAGASCATAATASSRTVIVCAVPRRPRLHW